MSDNRTFPNGFSSWYETHFEVSVLLYNLINESMEIDNPSDLASETFQKEGRGGIYELSCTLTDEFEELTKDVEWDGQWWEFLIDWLEYRLKIKQSWQLLPNNPHYETIELGDGFAYAMRTKLTGSYKELVLLVPQTNDEFEDALIKAGLDESDIDLYDVPMMMQYLLRFELEVMKN